MSSNWNKAIEILNGLIDIIEDNNKYEIERDSFIKSDYGCIDNYMNLNDEYLQVYCNYTSIPDNKNESLFLDKLNELSDRLESDAYINIDRTEIERKDIKQKKEKLELLLNEPIKLNEEIKRINESNRKTINEA